MTAEDLVQLKFGYLKSVKPLKDLGTYDEASRDPLGSLRLLWALRLQHPLSSSGALITILLLAADPISQQIVRYRNCATIEGGQTFEMPRSDGFPFKSNIQSYNSIPAEYLPDVKVPEPDFMRAINVGVSSPSCQVSIHCPSGNCTLPAEYSTVSYCARCNDVSDQVENINDKLE